jgi:protein-tyrosine phosphatase
VAGKDRTGLAAALLLTALGASRDTVFDDYLLSNTYWEMPTDVLREESEEVRKAVFTADPHYLEAAFAAMSEHYGSAESFVQNALGLNPARREDVLAQLVE